MDFIKTYFTSEKSESLLFIVLGLTALVFSAYAVWKWGDVFYKGIALPLILIGLIQVVVGSTVYFRTDKQIEQLEQLYQTNRSEFQKVEAPRMVIVMKNFSLYKKIEIAYVVIGLLLILLVPGRPFWLGIGVGMLLQGSIMLSLDIFAENRGTVYIQHIQNG